MTNFSISSAIFPSLSTSVQANWAPILLAPIAGSYERFVIGVAAVNDSGFHLELANSVDRLKCFYGDAAISIVNAIAIAGDYLRHDLAKRSYEALTNPDPAVSGITVGELREGEGANLEAIAQSWISALSSLYAGGTGSIVINDIDELAAESEASGDRLPFMVCAYVKHQRGGLERFFSPDLLADNGRRNRRSNQEPVIDYSGSRLVANFGTLRVSTLSRSFELVKLRLWDLNTVQIRERDSMIHRQFELILQRPGKNDPQVTDKQWQRLEGALQELEEQADEKKLRLRPLETVAEIGRHVLDLEAA
ncbi:hypothetical protein [Agrobacterium tumefaciens]|uniref:hypothetical protein n=1 Tax=Agrobacterium tumefaciens TaxID=358 RepID=UPI002207B457|nr:hypothetical protein [Agrobacterium tumefaciens]MDX8326125.1 hypothetical protein [Agrobacterium tumefaciens]UXU06454.1 hypothetical protein FY128_13385 [Agrobacterium tumefaciens]